MKKLMMVLVFVVIAMSFAACGGDWTTDGANLLGDLDKTEIEAVIESSDDFVVDQTKEQDMAEATPDGDVEFDQEVIPENEVDIAPESDEALTDGDQDVAEVISEETPEAVEEAEDDVSEEIAREDEVEIDSNEAVEIVLEEEINADIPEEISQEETAEEPAEEEQEISEIETANEQEESEIVVSGCKSNADCLAAGYGSLCANGYCDVATGNCTPAPSGTACEFSAEEIGACWFLGCYKKNVMGWNQAGFNSEHNGNVPFVGVHTPVIRKILDATTSTMPKFGAVIQGWDNTLVIPASSKVLFQPVNSTAYSYAIDAYMGAVLGIAGDPSGVIYAVGSNSQKWSAIDSDGKERWTLDTYGHINAITTNYWGIFTSSWNGAMYVFDRSGDLAWQYSRDSQPLNFAPTVDSLGNVFIASLDIEKVRDNHGGTGQLLWNRNVGEITSSIVLGRNAYAVVEGKKLVAVNKETGEVINAKIFDGCGAISAPAVGKDGIYTMACEEIVALNDDLSEKWSHQLPDLIGSCDTFSQPIVDEADNVYLSHCGQVFAYDREGDLLWFHLIDSAYKASTIIMNNAGEIFTASDNGNVYRLQEAEIKVYTAIDTPQTIMRSANAKLMSFGLYKVNNRDIEAGKIGVVVYSSRELTGKKVKLTHRESGMSFTTDLVLSANEVNYVATIDLTTPVFINLANGETFDLAIDTSDMIDETLFTAFVTSVYDATGEELLVSTAHPSYLVKGASLLLN